MFFPEDGNMQQGNPGSFLENILALQPLVMQEAFPPADPRDGLWEQVCELFGFADSSSFCMRPDSPEFGQVVQQMQQQQQAQNQQLMQMMQGLQMQIAKSQDQREWFRARADVHSGAIETTLKSEGHELDERKFTHEQEIDRAEIEIERNPNRETQAVLPRRRSVARDSVT